MPVPTHPHPLPASENLSPPGSTFPVRSSRQAAPQSALAARFGNRLRFLRHQKGMTQLEVANKFGIDRTFLSDLERGCKSVSLPFLEVFALGFGISLSELLDQI